MSSCPIKITYFLLNTHCYKDFIHGPEIYKETVHVAYYTPQMKSNCRNF